MKEAGHRTAALCKALRFLVAWRTARSDVVESEIFIHRDTGQVPVSVLRSRRRATRRGWILLHGLTRPGRAHPRLLRFARALAASGDVAVIPEIPEWRELKLAPAAAKPALQAGLDALSATMDESAGTQTGTGRTTIASIGGAPTPANLSTGAITFSFGVPHTLAATTEPELRGRLDRVVSFGGYADLAGTVRYLFTGDDGTPDAPLPDPYGRWIIAGNFLTLVPEYEAAVDVAGGVLALASEAGDKGVPSWNPVFEPSRLRLRAGVAEKRRPLFDLIAPPGRELPDRTEALRLVDQLLSGALRICPELEPSETLPFVTAPVHIFHGVGDNLIRPDQARHLAVALGGPTSSTVSRLLAHSDEEPWPGPVSALRELWTLLGGFARAFGEQAVGGGSLR